MHYSDKIIKKEVSIPYPLYQSEKGDYFIGQTPILKGENHRALTALKNPSSSNVNIFVNAITITNISALNISSEFYLRSSLSFEKTSQSVSCANLSIIPAPNPKAKIKYQTITNEPPKDGIDIFSRIISPYSTLVIDGGQIIISPGQSLIVYLGGFIPIELDSTIVAFGWWEEKICEYCDCCC